MIPIVILVLSLAAFVQFFVSYTRSVIAFARELGLSEPVRELFASQNRTVHGREFRYLLQLVKLCPESAGDLIEICAVRAYFGLLSLVSLAVRSLGLSIDSWVEHERDGCAYVAALALDRRVALHCELLEEAAKGF